MWGGVRPGNAPLNRGSPFCFPVFPAGNRPKIEVVSRYFPKNFLIIFSPNRFPIFPDWFTVTTFENQYRFPMFPEKKIEKKSLPKSFPDFSQKKFSPKSFPGFSRSVYSDPFRKPISFPGFSRFLSAQAYPQFSISFFLPKSFPDFSREILPVLASFVFLSRYFGEGTTVRKCLF